MKFFLSKYALTGGIKEAEGKAVKESTGDTVYARLDEYRFALFPIGKHAHETREAAVEAAETMRKRKIASLQKQIAKIEELDFSKEAGK